MITPANLLGVALLGACLGHAVHADIVDVGPRPLSLVAQMEEGDLKTALRACAGQSMQRTLFSIGHRGAPLMFPEHTVEGNVAAARMGAGILECDVTFTRDLELVCRHAQDDLHATTNILGTPLAGKCRQGSTRVSDDTPAVVECRASDLTLAEFRTLSGRMKNARSASGSGAASMDGSPDWRGDPRAASAGTLMTHAESIALFRSLGAKFAPELTDSDGVMFELLHVLARDVGVVGVFSDWPATVTYYANCMALD